MHPSLKCRFCGALINRTFVDLGLSPLCQTHIEPTRLHQPEQFYPLHTFLCEDCFLVQLPEHVSPHKIFDDYAYFSSYSDTWLNHARDYVGMISSRLGLDKRSLVVELASNDGYLLQYFAARGVPVLGIEPAQNVAEAAIRKGIPTISEFFGRACAERIMASHGPADLLLANNVLAHVPDLNDFVAGLKILLKPRGTITVEFPHLIRLIEGNQFDTIYHEHFSYFSFTTVEKVFAAHGLTLFDVEELPTHGGSLRIYARHLEHQGEPTRPTVAALLASERAWGVTEVAVYEAFGERVRKTKRGILDFLIQAKSEGSMIAGYGAPGKGNTLLNYCGIRTDFLDYTVDRNPRKQGRFTPGTRIPILSPEKIAETKPDYLFVLVWNLRDEVIRQNSFIREWGGRFVFPIPQIEII